MSIMDLTIHLETLFLDNRAKSTHLGFIPHAYCKTMTLGTC